MFNLGSARWRRRATRRRRSSGASRRKDTNRARFRLAEYDAAYETFDRHALTGPERDALGAPDVGIVQATCR